MDLRMYVENLHRQFAAAAEAAGNDARALAERLIEPLDAATRLTLQDALTAAAEEVTRELAPGSVEVRLRGRDLEFVVTPPPAETPAEEELTVSSTAAGEPDDGNVARINLRLPDQLKARVEQAADREGLSINSWLVRAAAAAVDRADPGRRRERPTPQGAQHYTGWTR
jgi:hypothetical protein